MFKLEIKFVVLTSPNYQRTDSMLQLVFMQIVSYPQTCIPALNTFSDELVCVSKSVVLSKLTETFQRHFIYLNRTPPVFLILLCDIMKAPFVISMRKITSYF